MYGVRTNAGYFNQPELSDVTFILKEGVFSKTGTKTLHAHWLTLCKNTDYFVGMNHREKGKKEIEVDADISRVVYYIYTKLYPRLDNPVDAVVDLHLAKQMHLEGVGRAIGYAIADDMSREQATKFLVDAMAIDDVLVKELFEYASYRLDAVVRELLDEDDLRYVPMVAIEALIDTIRFDLRVPQNAISLYNYWRRFHPTERFNVGVPSTEPDLKGYPDIYYDMGTHGHEIPNYVPVNKFLLEGTPPYQVPDTDIGDVRGNDFGKNDLMLLDLGRLLDVYPELSHRELEQYEETAMPTLPTPPPPTTVVRAVEEPSTEESSEEFSD
jgi:hypothetical protein